MANSIIENEMDQLILIDSLCNRKDTLNAIEKEELKQMILSNEEAMDVVALGAAINGNYSYLVNNYFKKSKLKNWKMI